MSLLCCSGKGWKGSSPGSSAVQPALPSCRRSAAPHRGTCWQGKLMFSFASSVRTRKGKKKKTQNPPLRQQGTPGMRCFPQGWGCWPGSALLPTGLRPAGCDTAGTRRGRGQQGWQGSLQASRGAHAPTFTLHHERGCAGLSCALCLPRGLLRVTSLDVALGAVV